MSATLPLPPPAADRPEWLRYAAARPHRHDLFALLRRWEATHPALPALGEALRPGDEPLRIGQRAELDFAPAPVQAIAQVDGVPHLLQRIFGLVGPNGPLPLHLTELARERDRHHADPVLQRFLDLLTHRFALQFYRAWAQAQPVHSVDRPDIGARWAARLGAWGGLGLPALSERDALGDDAKLRFIGRLSRQVRDADGLQAWCQSVFGVAVRIEPWVGHWVSLPAQACARLQGLPAAGPANSGLGRGAALGRTVWDVQHRFRIVLGPLTLQRYRAFLPGGPDLLRLRAMVRQWVGLELDWELRLVLDRREVPRPRLGRKDRGAGLGLGHCLWLGVRARDRDGDELRLNAERRAAHRPMTQEATTESEFIPVRE
ncbi:type VI secretion system baseplate subunit TssG [Aquabacterium sp. A7-Y]|uniref:type VI secretion system baseplate subunit TssG n=1 Tax=Aquabacterium sp. A7-Y TaxID=1349605 RepID=UPI00223CCC6D|nr:type VI secretion system baseplate subunit TssG [Aquabacterium sp. A7-Y]MCW7539697.1 type VI secretion system baseplate subunit TssG [Aquabacterium sp. A7-Y]